MLIQETIPPTKEGGWTLIKTYSSEGFLIRQDETEALYQEAIDPDFMNRTYTETDILPESADAGEEIPDLEQE